MTEDELNDKVEALERQKSLLTRNRNLCGIASVFLVYNFYNVSTEDSPPVWFLFAMSAIILTCIGIGIHGHLRIKKIERTLVTLYAEQKELLENT